MTEVVECPKATDDSRDESAASGSSVSLTQMAGFLGFLAAATTYFLILFKSPLSTGAWSAELPLDLPLGLPLNTAMLIVLTICLFAFSHLNDFFITAKGVNLLYLIAGLATTGGILCLLNAWLVMLAPLLLGLGLSAFAILWGMYLVTLNHRILLIFSSITVLFIAAVCLATLGLQSPFVILLLLAIFIASIFCALFVRSFIQAHISLVNRTLSLERSIERHGNKITLFVVGFMFGTSGILLTQGGLSGSLMVMTADGSLAVAGLILLIIRRYFPSSFEDLVRRCFGLSFLLLLPIPFVGLELRALLIGWLLLATIICILLVVNAMVETARFNLISPIWIIGKEGGFCLIGISISALLFSLVLLAGIDSAVMKVACFLAALLVNFAQIFINTPQYPFPEELPRTGEAPVEQTPVEELLTSARGGAIWRAKLSVVADVYGLSLRQREIMELLAKGRDSRYIMSHFVISRSTAKTHMYNLYRKVNIHSRQELLDLIEKTYVTADMIKAAADNLNK